MPSKSATRGSKSLSQKAANCAGRQSKRNTGSGRPTSGGRRPQISRRRPALSGKNRSVTSETHAACYLTEEWYHGLLPRADCEEMLKNQGEFLVHKENISSEAVSIAVNWDNKMQYFPIKQFGPTEFTIDDGKKMFHSVTDLVNSYMSSGDSLNNRDIILLNPVPRQSWEIRHEQLTLDKRLGEGAFGEVYKGQMAIEKRKIDVAIKKSHNATLLTQSDIEEMMKEARVMSKFNNQNIIKFYGVACERPPMMIVMEVVNGGSLDKYLVKNKAQLTKRSFYELCLGASKGLEYLHSQSCIHRDIAARNCLLQIDGYGTPEVKISDFGMSKDREKYRQENVKKMPIKWLAVETLRTRQFSFKTDVWSYGILMWEIYSGGAEPYPDKTSAETQKAVKAGYRMDAPPGMPDCMAVIMKSCWIEDDAQRPMFSNILEKMQALKHQAC